MKKLLDYIILVFSMMVFLASFAGSAAVYYYDNTIGLDTNNGLLPTCAWKTASRDRSGTANGDTFLFNGGQEFTGRFALEKNSIKVSSYGTGQATILNGIYSSTDVTTADSSIYNLNFSMTVSNPPIYIRGGSGYSVYNNTIDCNHIGYTQNGINTDVTQNTLIPSHDNSIYNNTISDCNGAIFINKGSYNTNVYGNTITTYGTNAKDGILTGDSTSGGNLAYDVFVYDNSIYCSGAGGIDIGESSNSNGINIGYDSKNVHVYDNSIYGTCSSGIQVDIHNEDDNYIYNNIVVNAYSGLRVWAWSEAPSNNAHFLNNTIIAGSYSQYGIWLRCGSGASLGDCERENIEIKNNIITSLDATRSILIDVGDAGDLYLPDMDNNVFYNLGTTGTAFGVARIDTTDYTSLADWQTALGDDANSMVADASLGDDHLDASYKPESDFPGINKGLTFDSIFTTDYDGYTRAGLWDIGAYEFHQGGTPGNRVTLKRITIK